MSDLGSFSQAREGGFLKKTALDSGPEDHSRILWGKVGKGTVFHRRGQHKGMHSDM